MDDIARLRNEYEHRKQRFAKSDLYSLFNRANLFIIQQRQRDVLAALNWLRFDRRPRTDDRSLSSLFRRLSKT